MNEAPQPAQPRRLQRKKPELPSSTYVSKGKRVSIKGVARIYLEDIEKAYDVFEAYVPHAPWAQFKEGIYQSSLERYQDNVNYYSKRGDEKRLSEIDVPEAPQHIVIEIPDYEPATTVEDLTSVPEKQAREITMKIGYGDLSLRCNEKSCDISTNENSPQADAAFDNLKEIISKRANRLVAILVSGWLILFVFIGSFILWAIGNITDNQIILLVGVLLSFGAWPIWIWEAMVWNRRKATVVFQYRRDAPTYWETNWSRIVTAILIGLAQLVLILFAFRVITGSWPDSLP